MNKIGTYLRTLSYGITFIFVVVVGLVPALVIASLPERWRYNRILYWLEHAVFWLFIKSWWLPVTYHGLDNIPKDTPVIFAANHQSSLDVALFGVLARGEPHIWLFISWLTKYPFFGYIIRRLEIIVDPRTPRRAVESVHRAIRHIKTHKSHLMIFPEGGRYTDGRIRDFFNGFAIIAEQTGHPVVPVFIKNSHKACLPKTILIKWTELHVIVGKPFMYQKDDDKHTFSNRVREWFLEHQE